MKIKILKDIPNLNGYAVIKAGEIREYDYVIDDSNRRTTNVEARRVERSSLDILLRDGYAEEVTDIDIEEIRKNKSVKLREAWNVGYDGAVHTVTTLKCLQQKEIEWFSAYRVVSGVIRQLNGDWVADWSDDTQFKRCLVYNHCDRSFKEKGFGGYNASTTQGCILPPCKDSETAQKLIDLCTPELETLFNIK